MEVPLKHKAELPCDPAAAILGIYPDKTITKKDACIPMFLAALFTIVKTLKHPKCSSSDEWTKKMRYHGIFLSHKQDETMPFAATWMDREIITLSE